MTTLSFDHEKMSRSGCHKKFIKRLRRWFTPNPHAPVGDVDDECSHTAVSSWPSQKITAGGGRLPSTLPRRRTCAAAVAVASPLHPLLFSLFGVVAAGGGGGESGSSQRTRLADLLLLLDADLPQGDPSPKHLFVIHLHHVKRVKHLIPDTKLG